MKHPNKDFVAEAIADYEAMKAEEQGKLIVQVLEDQPVMMGYLTNLADDFTEEEHEALVDSAVILINAFIAAGIPVEMVSHQMADEVIREKVDNYEEMAQADQLNSEGIKEIADSPVVFEDLRNRALFKSQLSEEKITDRHNFSIVLDTIISMIERSAAASIEERKS